MAAAKQLCFSVICVRNRRALVLAGEKRDPDFCLDQLFIKYTWVNEGDQNVTRSAQLLRTVDRSRRFPPTVYFTSTHAGSGSSQLSTLLASLIKPPTWVPGTVLQV